MRAVYGLSISLTGGLTDNAWPVWSGDGLRVFYASDRGGPYFDVYSKAIDGSTTERVEFEGPGGQWPTSVTRDGRVLVLENHAGRRQDLSLLTPGQSDRLDPLLDSEFNEWLGEVSPDGNWLAYESDESGGRVEIFVSPYPGVKAFRRQVSTGGGRYPLWNLDGSELTYVDPDGGFMAASVELSPGFRLLKVEKLFDWYRPYALVSGRNYDISPIDGRFLMSRPAAEGPDTIRISVVQHWLEELRERIPRGSR
jgi:eukaryotic-like serine/threonine-protein kinase